MFAKNENARLAQGSVGYANAGQPETKFTTPAHSPIISEVDRTSILLDELRSALGELGQKLDPIMAKSPEGGTNGVVGQLATCELHERLINNNYAISSMLQVVRGATSDIQL